MTATGGHLPLDTCIAHTQQSVKQQDSRMLRQWNTSLQYLKSRRTSVLATQVAVINDKCCEKSGGGINDPKRQR